MKNDIKKVRNIGISAHIDSGKTTLTERILFYTKRIHAMHDVKGKDGVGATMDSMELERERGITISSAATFCTWGDHEVNIIDTPGHVDFTIEVERALRVLDGAILVLCAVGGVQSQSITVDAQMKRYKVPCVAFVNKCDRSGANPARVVEQLKTRLGHNALLMQLPIGLEADFQGIVDLISMKAVYFDGAGGELLRTEAVPESLLPEAISRREELIDSVSLFSDSLTEAILEGTEISEVMIMEAVRQGTLERKITPVFIGSAYKNKGIQPLLDAVTRYLPCPADIENSALDLSREEAPVQLTSNTEDPVVALAFKLEDGIYGQLTYIRVYQGILSRGATVVNARDGKKVRIGRLVRMHADQMEDIEAIHAGYIGALFGLECQSGDTFAAQGLNLAMTSMFVPEPVISLAIVPKDKKSMVNMSKALNRFTKEDPTFRTHLDPETSETIIEGMGELHLDIYVERIRREYNAEVTTGNPRVAYRETITQKAAFNYTHRKQTGGSGQYGRVAGYIEPLSDEDFLFENKITGGAIPTQFIPACEKGFRMSMAKGPKMEFPVTGVKVVIDDGAFHAVDSSDMAFQAAARGAFREAYNKAKPVILEPIMKVVVETPNEFQGAVMGLLNQRRGMIVGTQDEGQTCVIEAQTPLAEMFGFSTVIRSATQGKAQFTMEFSAYRQVPQSIAEKITEEVAKRKKSAA
ncbi:elongation factor G [Syntrophus aciditrophicus]|uniref:Elongation factor G 1 n=1 Tax=Syntrophus aciditrophicus (strain SB) TaxID=56780 RepID=EFG1_SYNAS|nr:elongation factor G [Syntrophus aciditrophicus]Q2LTB9.1 RecName: Full=Elongation factor G 1; Short=EF-G 1 [Syntrophus aciditrophicus SB]ABC77328.1 protein translation elongation factor G (EF-G) [Syntrophus aciditrophicus SB]